MPVATRRRFADGFVPGLDGRPKLRTITACFGFSIVPGPIFGIVAHPPSAAVLSDKCLKKWYRLPAKQGPDPATGCLPKRFAHAMRVASRGVREAKCNEMRRNRRSHMTDMRNAPELHNECAKMCDRASMCVNGRQGYRGVKMRA
jgi:hypothetical protein